MLAKCVTIRMKTTSCSSAFSLRLSGESTVAGGGALKQKPLSGRSSFSQAVAVIWSQGKEANEMKKAPVRDLCKKNLQRIWSQDASSAVVCSENWCFRMRTGAFRVTAVRGIALMIRAQNATLPPPTQGSQGKILNSKVRRQPQLLLSGMSA